MGPHIASEKVPQPANETAITARVATTIGRAMFYLRGKIVAEYNLPQRSQVRLNRQSCRSNLTAFAGGPGLIRVRFLDLTHVSMHYLPVVTHHPRTAKLRLQPFARFSPADSLMRWKTPSNRRNRFS